MRPLLKLIPALRAAALSLILLLSPLRADEQDVAAPDNGNGSISDTPGDTAPPAHDDTLPDQAEPDWEISSEPPPPREIPTPPEGGWSIYVVPIEGPITSPQLYILRRALKEAIDNNIDIVLLQMDTPGGALGTTLEMMEALDNFTGETITFVNNEAISAGSYIAIATNDIWFSPRGIMGAAEAITGSGEDINEGMKRKIDSYLRAKVRVLSDEHRYRADVQRAMMDPTFLFEIDGEVIKSEGELLSLTAKEAIQEYGYPPEPLLASGIAESIEELLDAKYGPGNYTVREFEITWSEHFAKWFQTIAPLLLGIGILLLVIEMKTPNFGLIGGLGIGFLLLVFASNYFAGIAGNEEILVFLLGVVFIAVEIFLLPGTLIFGLLGGVMVIGALLWAMADIWPGDAFSLTPDLFYVPVLQLLIGLIIAFVGMAALAKILPRTWFWDQIVLAGAVGKGDANPVRDGTDSHSSKVSLPGPGTRGIAATDFHPGGLVEIEGHRYEATSAIGSLRRGDTLEVVERRDFSLVVRKAD